MTIIRRKSRASRPPKKSAEQIFDELVEELISEISTISDPVLLNVWGDSIATLRKTGDVSALLEACKWKRGVVPLDEFLFSRVYMGMERNELYPSVLDALHDLDSDSYDEAVLTGALGIGKTTIANVSLCRDLYKMSCMRSPQQVFGIQKQSAIVFTIQSVRLNTAKKAVFEELGRYLHASPYFTSYYRYDKHITSEMIFRDNNIRIMPVSSSTTGVISMNVVGGILDEMNFMQKVENSKSQNANADGAFDQAAQLYQALSRRRKSRFLNRGNLPGILFVVSSSRFPTDFTETKARESTMEGGSDDTIYVYRHSQWSAKGRDKFSPNTFRVQVGNEKHRSKILQDGEVEAIGCRVIEVPDNFINEFRVDVDGSLRDFAGVTTMAAHPFFGQRDKIDEAMRLAASYGYHNPFTVDQVDLSVGIPKPAVERIRKDVKMPRHCHIDLGLKHDAAGLAIGHLAGYKAVSNEQSQSLTTYLPVIAIELVLRIVPPPGGEISLEKIRKLLISLRDKYGIPVKTVSFDGFQSVDSRQLLTQENFRCGYMSVEKIEPWRTFRDAVYEGRVMLAHSEFLLKELAELEQVIKNGKEKVDHRPAGSKDVADAVCGVAAYITKQRISWNPPANLIMEDDITLLSGSYDGLSVRANPRRLRIGRSRTGKRVHRKDIAGI